MVIAGGETLEQPVFLQADRHGKLFLVSGNDRRFLPLLPNGKLGEPVHYDPAGLAHGFSHRVAMSRNGDWIVFSPPDLHLYRDGKDTILPRPNWPVIDVGFLRDDPVVNTGTGWIRPHSRTLDAAVPPVLVRWTGKDWEPFLREAPPRGIDPEGGGVRALRTLHLLGDSKGTLWLANESLYRIRRYSTGGKLLLDLARGTGKLEEPADAAQVQKKFAAAMGQKVKPQGATVTYQAATSRRFLEALAEGRDGKVYFLADEPSEGGDFALDRWNSADQRMERVLLHLREPAFLTLAAGSDALYIASVVPGRGPWRISWDDLDQARWTKLRDVRIDQAEPEPDEDPEATGGVPPAPPVGRRHRSQS